MSELSEQADEANQSFDDLFLEIVILVGVRTVAVMPRLLLIFLSFFTNSLLFLLSFPLPSSFLTLHSSLLGLPC